MSNEIALLERQFEPMLPQIGQMIARGSDLDPRRIVRSIVVSCERNPKLLQCERGSLFEAAFSAGGLGIIVDGVTGQGYIIPFKGKAQFQIGYKGYGTIAARSGFILGGNVVFEGERPEIMLGSGGYARVKPDFTIRGRDGAKIVAAFATMKSNSFPDEVDAMSLDEIMNVRARSAAVKGGGQTPWNGSPDDFRQMAIKTVKKRLAKSAPLDLLHLAGAFDDAAEQGKHAYIRPEDGTFMVDDAPIDITPEQPQPAQPFNLDETRYEIVKQTGEVHPLDSFDTWRAAIQHIIGKATDPVAIQRFIERNHGTFAAVAHRHENAVDELRLWVMDRIADVSRN